MEIKQGSIMLISSPRMGREAETKKVRTTAKGAYRWPTFKRSSKIWI